MKEYFYEQKLNINTKFNRYLKQRYSRTYYEYEPTPYSALEELIEHHQFSHKDHLVDFGCGLGRLHFFLHYHIGMSVTGIEMNHVFYKQALENLQNYQTIKKKNIERLRFHWIKAEDYEIEAEQNQFYFFNPFSVNIFRKVMMNILRSHEQHERPMSIILYYAQTNYLRLLDKETNFNFAQEIKIPYLYNRDQYERFMIYQN